MDKEDSAVILSAILPIRTISLANSRMHWAKKARYVKELRRAALAIPSFDLPARVVLTRIGPRALDEHDNLPSALKPLVDGISDRLGIRDCDSRIVWRYAQERGKYAVRIDVYALPASIEHAARR